MPITEEAAEPAPEATSTFPYQPSSGESTEDAPANYSNPDHFLSPRQLSSRSKVHRVLAELENIESLYQNRARMGDAHPQYRTLSFRRKVEALTLWLKVVEGLSWTLSAVSVWLGVPVILPEICRGGSGACSRSVSSDSKTDELGERRRERRGGGGRLETDGAEIRGVGEGGGGGGVGQGFQIGSPPDPLKSLNFLSLRRLTSKAPSSSSSTQSRRTLQRMFSSYQSVSLEGAAKGPYRKFVDRGLKKHSLFSLIGLLQKFIQPVQNLAIAALSPHAREGEEDREGGEEGTDDPYPEPERRPLLRPFLCPTTTDQDTFHPREVTYERATSVSSLNWGQEFEAMYLPHFGRQYIQLVHTPLDVMHECLKLQLELQLPEKPSPLSVKQLVCESRDTLQEAIKVRRQYRECMEVVTHGDQARRAQVDSDLEFFEEDLNGVLTIYFSYLQTWVQVSSGHVLEEEWRHVKEICSQIHAGEAEAGRRFCDMAAHLLETTGDLLQDGMDRNCHLLHDTGASLEHRKKVIGESCRNFKELFVLVRERASKAIGFAKMLRKDLEIAADFSLCVSVAELLAILKASDHTRVVLPHQRGKLVFVPEHMEDSVEDIQQLLSVSFAHSDSTFHLKDSYLLLVAIDTTESVGHWSGKTVEMKTSAETTIAISEIQVDSVKMIVSNSTHLAPCRTSFLNAVGVAVQLTNEQTSSHDNVAQRISDLKLAACALSQQLIEASNQVADHLGLEDTSQSDDLGSPYRTTMRACFNLGFEYIREVFRLVGDELAYQELGSGILDYARLWMRFVLDKCDRGRGTRPRWASTGLDFLTVACSPRQLASISPTNFESLKKLMNRTLGHVIGEAPSPQVYGTEFSQTPHRPPHPPRYKKKQHRLVSAISDPSPITVEVMTHVKEEVEEEEEDVEEEEEEEGKEEEEEEERRRGRGERKEGENRTDGCAPNTGNWVSPRAGAHSDSTGMECGPPVGGVALSPPASTESVSSGHYSPPAPPHQNCLKSSSVKFSTPTHPPPSSSSPSSTLLCTPTSTAINRVDSNISVASGNELYISPYFMRSPSAGSVASGSCSGSEGGGERWASIRKSVQLMEMNRDAELRSKRVIGCVIQQQRSSHPPKLSSLRQTHFKWQRGRKLGEGRFGKVYEVMNLDTGEMMAVKQISFQEDSGTLQTIVDEVAIFQKVKHENIVGFHGLEIHHTELYIFLEYCHEGTLWSIARQGLPEHMIRRYTRDLVRAVDALHDKGIVHRDIKGANIFLSDDSIKLGDFGLSVQLKNLNKTMPREINQQAGTIPYLSPEVVLKQDMGRPLDIWSVGCVVVEMATGKLPWADCDNQFQIMFKLGNGLSPSLPPSSLSTEGIHFLELCFQPDPSLRSRATQLLQHPFVKVTDD